MKNHVLLFLFVIGSAGFGQLPDSTISKLPIAVLALEGKGISQQEADILSERLRTAFVQDGRFQVIERSQMETILKEQGLQQSGCASNECLVQAGLILGVKEMIAGSVGKIGDRFAVDVRLFDVESTEIIKAVSRNVTGSIDVLLDIMPELVRELAGPAKVLPPVNGRPETVLLTDRDVEKGIEAFTLAVEKAGESLGQHMGMAGKTTSDAINKIFNRDGSVVNPDAVRGRDDGRSAAREMHAKLMWSATPLTFSLIATAKNNFISGLIAGWIAKQIYVTIAGDLIMPNSRAAKIQLEPAEYQTEYRKSFEREWEKDRSKKGTLGTWIGVALGVLLF